MSILITTIGQRDVQLVIDDKCYPFERNDLWKIQSKIEEVGFENIEWKPYIEGEKRLIQIQERKSLKKFENIDFSKKLIITFPIFEKTLKEINREILKKRWNKLEKIYLFYTDRKKNVTNLQNIPEYNKSEPWLFHRLIIHFYPDILTYYKIEQNEIIPVKIKDKDNDIIRTAVLESIVPFFKNELYPNFSNDKNDKVLVACSTGMPDIKNVIEEVSSLYFPKKSIFYEQDQKNDNVIRSNYHIYKRKAKILFELTERINAVDFDSAWDIIKKYNYIFNKKTLLYKLIEISYQWLSGDPNNTQKKIKVLINEISDLKLKNILNKMDKMISENKNRASRSLIRTIYLYNKKIYWGAATVFITAVENLIIEYINFYTNSYNEKRNLFEIKKIGNDFKPAKKFVYKNDNNFLPNNWKNLDLILSYIRNNYKGYRIGELSGYFLSDKSDFYKFKQNSRNTFIHKGESVSKKEFDKVFYHSSRVEHIIEDTKIFNFIAEVMENINIIYYNWLPDILPYIENEIKNISILEKISS